MNPIDSMSQQMKKLVEEIKADSPTIFTEQDTRIKVIDRILIEILGWQRSAIFTESKIGEGFIDYKIAPDGLSRLIVEAKRDGTDFGFVEKVSRKAYKLNGPVFKSNDLKKGIYQAIGYCGQQNTELACVTNGKQWIVFRGSRLGDGRDTCEGMAFIFHSLENILEHFSLFFDLLSYDAVTQYKFRAYFQEEEGQPIRTHDFRKTIRHPDTKRLISSDALSGDLDKVMTSFFRRLSGDSDPEMIVDCFVVTKESEFADQRLLRISEDLINRVQGLGSNEGEKLIELIQRAISTQRNEFVVVVGTKGAGKSTFIDRFFGVVLPRNLAKECIVIKVNLKDSDGDENGIVPWLNANLLSASEKAVFGEDGPQYKELQGMFFDEYKRWRNGPYKHLYEQNKEEFKIEFGKHVEARREDKPHEYITRLIRNVIYLRRKIPCLVFDNTDHFSIDFQQKVFQYARSIYENSLCVAIVPITDKTSWQLSRQGALQSFDNETLFLPTPPPERVLERRIAFLERKIEEEKKEPGRGYFLSRGISLTLENISGFAGCLQAIFLRTGSVSGWIGSLANLDIRRCLELTRNVISSPYIEVSELIKAYIAKSSLEIKPHKIKKAIINGKYDIYPCGENKFVQNIFSISDEIDTSPLLGLRILQVLVDARHSSYGEKETFLEVFQMVDYFRAMSFEPRAITVWLNAMLKTGLALSYDPTVTEIGSAKKIEISPSGLQHLHWGKSDMDYVAMMLPVTPILNRDTYEEIRRVTDPDKTVAWRTKIGMFLKYLLQEDSKYCVTPKHESYEGQNRLTQDIRGLYEFSNREKPSTTA